MSEIYPVTRERHGGRAWNKAAGYGWARQELIVAVARQEALQLMMYLPLGFVRHDDKFEFIALLGLREGENVIISADGRWLAPRVPAALHHYPFRRLRDTEGNDMLGVDEAGLVPSDTAGGTPLYDSNNTPAAELVTILGQLVQDDKERLQACQITAILDQHGLLEPWEMQLKDDGGMRKVEGLYRVNEKKLNELPAEAFVALRNSGALLIAYCQLLSMQHIHQLGRLAEAQAVARQRTAQAAAGDHGTISFANL